MLPLALRSIALFLIAVSCSALALGQSDPPPSFSEYSGACSATQVLTGQEVEELGYSESEAATAATIIAGIGTGGAGFVKKGAKKVFNYGHKKLNKSAVTNLAAKGAPKPGDTVYRVWGDKAGPNGSYWSRTNPADVPNYRDAAGLPDRNSGRFVTEGRLTDTTGVTSTPGGAASLGRNRGGLDEVVIPNPGQQVQVTGVSGVNAEF